MNVDPARSRVLVIGGGPAGLMAAETLRNAGLDVALHDAAGSVGRKILIAGKGGLNLTHAEPLPAFIERFGPRSANIGRWLDRFGPEDLRSWARELGVATMVGSSGRVFPADLKAAPLLRGWVRRLRASGVQFHLNTRWTGWTDCGDARFQNREGVEFTQGYSAMVLALGGGSWPQLGSDGLWTETLAATGVDVAPLQPSNCGFECTWSEHFRMRNAGAPLKTVSLRLEGDTASEARRGEFVIADYGVEGSLIYAFSSRIRDRIRDSGACDLRLDLAPERSAARLIEALARSRGRRSISEHLRRSVGLSGLPAALLRERLGPLEQLSAEQIAAGIKSLPLQLTAPRPLAEAISSAGGVRLESLNQNLMLSNRPGVFCAGEMLDWEAPTGGYLLTACFASGVVAAEGVIDWLQASPRRPAD